MRVLLISLPASGENKGFAGGSRFPIGIAIISAVLKKAGFSVKVIDLNLEYCLNKVIEGWKVSLLLCTSSFRLRALNENRLTPFLDIQISLKN